ncbi:MAG: protein kinase [Myxococcales bacterium]|nr:protein kinase [Myxococcales bacterium]
MTGVLAEVGSTANNYQILAKLAMGGMAEIFLARGASVAGVERYVVLKRIIREKANDTLFVQMFLEEARLAAQLQHANIAQVYDIGKLGDSYFFTMEYVHGETVRGLLQRARSLRRELPLNVILTVIAGTAAGLHHAHDRIGIDGRPLNIVHRDVSPSNLMISYDGSVKVVDFGVAKAENRAQETKSGAVKGKISYLSPEQCRGAPVDRRSDLFSLGIVLWEMLTIERLYRRNSDFENMTAIVNEPTPSPSEYRPNLPRDLEQLALRLLAKRPEQRFTTGGELVEEIEEIAARNGLALSISALGRFMKELFGQRPEPWIELETRDHAEGVTVTSEPLPPELSLVSDPLEGQLKHVRDLSKQFAAQHNPASESRPPAHPASSQRMTAPGMPMQDDPRRTVSMRPAAAPPPLPSPDAFATIPMYRQPAESVPSPWGANPPGTGSVPMIPVTYPPAVSLPSAQAPQSHSGSHPGLGSVPMLPYPVVPAAPTVAPLEQRRTNVKLIGAVAALAVVAGVVAWLIARGGDSVGAGEPATVHDAAVAAITADASVAVVAAITADASVVAAAPSDAADVNTGSGAATVAPDPLATIHAALTEGRTADAIATCNSTAITPTLAAECTRAACTARDAAHAKQWIAQTAGETRAALQSECKRAGTELGRTKPTRPTGPTRPTVPTRPTGPEGPPKPDPCKVDPMSCQH